MQSYTCPKECWLINNLDNLIKIQIKLNQNTNNFQAKCIQQISDICAGLVRWSIQCGAVITRSVFFQNLHSRHTLTGPWGRDMGCMLWFYCLIHFQPLLSPCRRQYRDKLDRVIMALDCTCNSFIGTPSPLFVSHPSPTCSKLIKLINVSPPMDS